AERPSGAVSPTLAEAGRSRTRVISSDGVRRGSSRSTGCPHALQKRAPGLSRPEQFAQRGRSSASSLTAAPQERQKRAPSTTSAPHAWHARLTVRPAARQAHTAGAHALSVKSIVQERLPSPPPLLRPT